LLKKIKTTLGDSWLTVLNTEFWLGPASSGLLLQWFLNVTIRVAIQVIQNLQCTTKRLAGEEMGKRGKSQHPLKQYL